MVRGMLTMICMLLLGAGPLCAQEVMSLQTALDIAVKGNPLIKASDENVIMKKMDKQAALAQMLPTVKLTYGYYRLNDTPTLNLGTDAYLPVLNEAKPIRYDTSDLSSGNLAYDWDTRRPLFAYLPDESITYGTQNNYQFTVEATQVLFAGGALYNNYRMKANDERISEIDKLTAVRDLKNKVIDAYYGVIAARQGVEVTKTAEGSVQAHVVQAQAFFKHGVIPKNDLLTAQVKLAEAKQAEITADNMAKTAEAGLNVALARNISEPVTIESEIPEPPLERSFEECVAVAMQNRQEIKTLELQVDSTRKAVSAARGSFSPQVAASYKYTRSGEDPDVPDDYWSIGVGLEWTLFGTLKTGGTSYTNLKKAKAAEAAALNLLQSKKDEVTFDVKTAYLNAQEAKAKMEVSMLSIEQAEENLRIQKHKYNLQAATSTDVLDAETMRARSKIEYIRAKANYATSIAKLHASMGIL